MMSDLIKPGQGVLYMKVGVHAKETLQDIIERKTKEIEDAGFAFWGYGGNTCHPTTMVQPFAREFAERDQDVVLCMQEMDSRHFADPVRAEFFSADGRQWQKVPAAINVLGSRYALAIKNLRREEFALPLSNTRVAIGNSQGRVGSDYIAGRVDKACFQIEASDSGPQPINERPVSISLVADLCEPYAVFLKN